MYRCDDANQLDKPRPGAPSEELVGRVRRRGYTNHWSWSTPSIRFSAALVGGFYPDLLGDVGDQFINRIGDWTGCGEARSGGTVRVRDGTPACEICKVLRNVLICHGGSGTFTVLEMLQPCGNVVV